MTMASEAMDRCLKIVSCFHILHVILEFSIHILYILSNDKIEGWIYHFLIESNNSLIIFLPADYVCRLSVVPSVPSDWSMANR